MAEAARPAPPSTPLEEVRERYRAAEEVEPGQDRTRYVEALKVFLATVEQHTDAIGRDAPTVAPMLDEAAMAFYRSSHPELAERAVDLGLRLSPGASSLLHHKALVLLSLNRDLDEVVRLVDQALEGNPHDKGLWATRGDALRLQGHAAGAAEAYLKAQELDPTSSQYVDRALRVAPNDPHVLRAKVELARVRGGDTSALEAAEELLKENPNDRDLSRSRAEILATLGRTGEALEAIRAFRASGTDELGARSLEARLLFELGRGDEATPLAKGILDPESKADVPTLEGIAQGAAATQPELALAARERLRETDPRNVKNLLALRDLAVRTGRTEVGLAACRAVLALAPDNLEAMRGVAELQASAGHLHEALDSYRAIARSHPHAVGDFRKALDLARQAALPEASREFAEAILVVEPKDADARLELARGLASTGDLDGALVEFEALLDAHPGELPYLLEKRALLSSSNDLPAKLKVLDEIFRLDPTRTDVAVERGHLHLSIAYDLPDHSSEREEEARAALVAYERASTDPEASAVCLLGIARASRLVDDPERALSAYGQFLALPGHAQRWDVRKERAHTLREMGRYAEAAEEYREVIVGGLEDHDLYWGAAEVYERLNQEPLALRYLDLLVRREPTNPLYLRRRAQLLLKTGKRDEALRALQQVVGASPNDPHPCFEAAEVLRVQGAYSDAIDYLRRGLALDPKNRYGLLALAETLLLAGHYPEVVPVVDPLLKDDPNDVAAWKTRAEAFRALGRPQEVVYSLQAILLLEPDNSPALLEMFRLRKETGDRKEAYDALSRLVRTSASEAQDPSLHLERGELAASLGLPEEANTAYERAAALDPTLTLEIALRRARLRLTAGRPDLALELLDGALAAAAPSPKNVAALLLRAEILSALERPVEARTVFEEVRSVDPTSTVALCGIAQATISEGRPDDAAAFLRAALPGVPPTESLYLLLAEAESARGELGRAAEVVQAGTGLLPKSVALWSRLGEIDVARQEWAPASGAFAHALSLAPSSVDLLLRAAYVAERLGHPNDAVAFYDRATEAFPSSKQAWASRGLALVTAGRAAEGLTSFDRALALDSDFQPAKDGKRLAVQKTRDAEVQRYGRDALLLEARLHRTVTKNDLFVLLHVPFEFLEPVLQEISRSPKVDLDQLEGTEQHDLENASYHLITAALDRRPPGVERRGMTLADVAALVPPGTTLPQIERLFGYLKAVLEAEMKADRLKVTPDVEDLARKAFALPPGHRTLFQLVRTLRVGIYKARVIKAVEEAGASGHRPLPSLDLGAYSPEFRSAEPPGPESKRAESGPAPKHEPTPAPRAASAPAPPPAATPTGGVKLAAPAKSVHEPRLAHESTPAPVGGPRCVGCGGLASSVHACGAVLCQHCAHQFPKCPKCNEPLDGGSLQALPHDAPHAPSAERPASAADKGTGSPPPRRGHVAGHHEPPSPIGHTGGGMSKGPEPAHPGPPHGERKPTVTPGPAATENSGPAAATPEKPATEPTPPGSVPPAKPKLKRDDEPRL